MSVYESEAQMKEANDHSLHHEKTLHAQQTFFDRVQKLSQVLQDLGNPFQEDSTELFTIDSKDVAHPSSADLVHTHMDKGQKKYQELVKGLAENPTSFYVPIKKNRLDSFS